MRNRVLIAGACGGMLVIALVVSILFAAYKVHVAAVEKRALQETETQREREEYRHNALAKFGDPVPVSKEIAAAFQAAIDKLGIALKWEKELEVENAFDMERYIQELAHRGILDGYPGGDSQLNRTQFLTGLRSDGGYGKSIGLYTKFRGEQTTVRLVRWSDDRSEVVVSATHRFDEFNDHPYRMRWWLIRKALGWKVYDLEEVELGLRKSEALVLAIHDPSDHEQERKAIEVLSAVQNLREATFALTVGKAAGEAEQYLEPARAVNLPPPAAGIRALVEGRLLLDRKKPLEALERFEEADRLHPGSPILNHVRAAALIAANRADEALTIIRKYLAEIGPNSEAYIVQAKALETLKRNEEACFSYRKALDEQPGNIAAMDGLRRTLTGADKAELADRLEEAPEPGKVYGELIELALSAGDNAGATALLSGIRKKNPGELWPIRNWLQAFVKAKKFTEAKLALNDFLKEAATEEDRRQILNFYLFLMAGCDLTIEGYSSAPDKYATNAFRSLAEDLEEDLLEVEAENRTTVAVKLLRELIDAHRKRVPDDVWLRYYEAVLMQKARDYKKAESEYTAAYALYLKTAPKPKPGEKDLQGDRFRIHRVECLYQLKQGAKAYAEIGPPSDTFRQLANAYLRDKDVESLEKLVGVHRDAFPKDPSGAYWMAEILYIKEKYSAAADAYRTFIKMEDSEVFERMQGTEKCIRSYLRSARIREARSLLADQKPDSLPIALRAAVALADGRPGQADDILAELGKQLRGFGFMYYDPDFAREIAKPEFDSLRKKYPEAKPPESGP